MATPLRLGGPDAAPGGTARTGYTTSGSQGWAAPQTRGYSGPVYGSWVGVRRKPPKIKNAKQRALLFIRNTNGKPGGRWVARKPASVAVKKPPAPVVAPAPGTAAGYTGPYADLPEWARKVMLGIDSDFANHSKYVGFNTDGSPTGSGVASWLKSAMEGVNSMAGGMLGQYQSNAGNVADTVAQAAGASPMQVNSPLAGGVVSSPQAYDYIGRSQGMAAQGQAIRAEADAYATQSRTNLGLASQGYLNSLADYAKGLPALYAEKRRGAREEIDKFLAEAESEAQQLALDAAKLEETQRSNKADEAIRTLNARNGLITALVNSGIKIDANTLRAIDVAADNERQAASDRVRAEDVRADNARADADLARRTAADAQRAQSGGGSVGRTAQWYRQRGYTRPGGTVNVGRINRQVWDVGRDNAGNVWVKKRSTAAANGGGGAGGSGAGGAPAQVRDLWPDFQTKYAEIGNKAASIPMSRRVDYVANQVVAWIVNKNRDFTKSGGAVDEAKIKTVIDKVIGKGNVYGRVFQLLMQNTKMVNGNRVWK